MRSALYKQIVKTLVDGNGNKGDCDGMLMHGDNSSILNLFRKHVVSLLKIYLS